MDWINIHTGTMHSEAVLDASPVQLATWLKLLHYCCLQENGGRLTGAKAFDDRKWLRMANVTKEEVQDGDRLWRWRGEDLLVSFYPSDKELIVKRNREVGAKGGKASGQSRREHRMPHMDEASASSAASSCSADQLEASASPSAVASASTEGNGREGKGKERNEREGNAPAQGAVLEPHIPSEQEVLGAFVADGVPEDYLRNQFTWFNASPKRWLDRGDLVDWRWIIRRRWAQDRAAWESSAPAAGTTPTFSGGQGGSFQKNGALTVRHQVVLVEKELAEVSARIEDAHALNLPIDPADRKRKADLKKRRAALLVESGVAA